MNGHRAYQYHCILITWTGPANYLVLKREEVYNVGLCRNLLSLLSPALPHGDTRESGTKLELSTLQVGSITLLLITNSWLLHHFGLFQVFINNVVQDYKVMLTVCFGPSST